MEFLFTIFCLLCLPVAAAFIKVAVDDKDIKFFLGAIAICILMVTLGIILNETTPQTDAVKDVGSYSHSTNKTNSN